MRQEVEFYVVWCPSHASPVRQHATCAEAIAEAERLANKHHDRQFIVLKPVAGRRFSAIESIEYAPF